MSNRGEKTRNNNEWTESRFHSFIKSALRAASQRWPPKYRTLASSFVGTYVNPDSGRQAKFYQCESCRDRFTAKNVEVNHKEPVIPTTGFDSWDGVIERMFCEQDKLEVLCKPCHKKITKQENEQRKLNGRN